MMRIGRTFQRIGRRAGDLDKGMQRASGGANILTRSVSSLGGVLGAISIAAVTHQLGRLSVESIRAAGSMEQLRHATTQVLGSAELAEQRLEELVVVAKRKELGNSGNTEGG